MSSIGKDGGSEDRPTPSRWSLLPRGATRDAGWILAGRGVRSFADGFVALLLPAYLTALGFDSIAIGIIITATLLGSAGLTLSVGFLAHRFARRRLLFWACLLMIATGCGFAVATDFWPILIVGFIGTMNPSQGDVSLFLPIEHTMLVHSVDAKDRTALFARYSIAASFLGALGSLAAGLAEWLDAATGIGEIHAIAAMFLLYALLGAVAALLYRPLSAAVEPAGDAPQAALGPSRGIVYKLAALFSLDAFAGGFVVQSLLALWLFERFDMSLSAASLFFFWSGVLSAFSFPVAAWLARRIGLVNTMVYTHVPSSICLILAAVAPTLPVVLALLLLRAALSQMDVPTRSSYVMAVVTEAERAAAASFTAVPRSLAAAASPALAGALFSASLRAWPLVICGTLKIIYDALLLFQFRHLKPPEER